MNVRVKKAGKGWNQFNRLPGKVESVYGKYVVGQIIHNLAELFVDELKKYILSQPEAWPKLSKAYAEWKKVNDLDSRTWIATESLLKRLTVKRIRANSYFAGALDKKHPKSTLSYGEIAMVLEFGVKKSGGWLIPPRPVFKPVFNAFTTKYASEMRKYGVKMKLGES